MGSMLTRAQPCILQGRRGAAKWTHLPQGPPTGAWAGPAAWGPPPTSLTPTTPATPAPQSPCCDVPAFPRPQLHRRGSTLQYFSRAGYEHGLKREFTVCNDALERLIVPQQVGRGLGQGPRCYPSSGIPGGDGYTR